MKMKLEGVEDLQKALMELKGSTAKGVARKVLKKNGQLIADAASALAPEGEGHLAKSYVVTSRLTKSQYAKARREGRDDVFQYVGTANPAGQQQEFGNAQHGAQPHLRPAWEGEKDRVLQGITQDMTTEVAKSVERARRKAARAKSGR